MSNETNNKMKVYQTILEQLGGNKFKVMTGSKNFRYDLNCLTMDLAEGMKLNKYISFSKFLETLITKQDERT